MMEEHTDRIYDPTLLDQDETTDAINLEEKLAVTASVVVPLEIRSPKMTQETTTPPAREVLKLLNNELIKEARETRNRWELLQERINKIEKSRGTIKESVYEKVAADYQNRVQETQAEFKQLKLRSDEELVKIRHQEAEVTREVMEHEDILEEAQFRHQLGEYTESDFKDIANKEESHLNKLRKQQDHLHEAIRQYEDIFSGIHINFEPISVLEPSRETPLPPPQPEEAIIHATATKTAEAEEPLPPPLPNVGTAAPRAVDRTGKRAAKPQPRSKPAIETEEKAEAPEILLEDILPEATVTLQASPSPASTQGTQAVLILYEKGQVAGQFPIVNELTIGRSPSNTVVLKEPRVSRRHAVIRHSGSRYMLIDNNSSNGCYVNGEAVTEQILQSGDRLQIGSFEMVFTV